MHTLHPVSGPKDPVGGLLDNNIYPTRFMNLDQARSGVLRALPRRRREREEKTGRRRPTPGRPVDMKAPGPRASPACAHTRIDPTQHRARLPGRPAGAGRDACRVWEASPGAT